MMKRIFLVLLVILAQPARAAGPVIWNGTQALDLTTGGIKTKAITAGSSGQLTVNSGTGTLVTTGNVSAAQVATTTTVNAGTAFVGPMLRLQNSSHNLDFLPPTLAADIQLSFPNSAGLSGQVLQTDGSGALSWAPQSEKNYVASGSKSATGWTASSGGVTCTSVATNLPDATIGSALAVTGVSGSTAFCFNNFAVDESDYNKKLKLAFNQKTVTYTASDFKVDVYSCTVAWSGSPATTCSGTSTRLSLSTDLPSTSGICLAGTSCLPSLTGSYRTAYDTPGSSAKFLQVRIGLNATSTDQVNFSSIVTGPGVVEQGAAVSQWQSYTTTLSTGLGGGTGTLYWRRIGDSMEIQGSVTAGSTGAGAVTVTLPSGYTINSSALGPFQQNSLGIWVALHPSTQIVTGGFTGFVYYTGTTTLLGLDLLTNSSGKFAGTGGASLVGTGDLVAIKATVPINEWAGSGTVNIAQNDVEYVYNTSTSTSASDTTSFGYGPGGAQIQALSAGVSRRVRFPTPIQASDSLQLEISADQIKWMPLIGQTLPGNAGAAQVCPYTIQNGVGYGLGQLGFVNSTDVDVNFGAYAYPNGATYGAAGSAWGTNAGNFYWRVRKLKAGQAVGFGLASSTGSGLIDKQITATTYTPTFTNIANTTGFTLNSANYAQTGNMVTVWGMVTVTLTSTAATSFYMSLPVTMTNNSIIGQLAGEAASDTNQFGPIRAEGVTNGRAQFNFSTLTPTPNVWFHFTYRVN